MRLSSNGFLALIAPRILILLLVPVGLSLTLDGRASQASGTSQEPAVQTAPGVQSAPEQAKAEPPESEPVDQGLIQVQADVATVKSSDVRSLAASLGLEIRRETATTCSASGSRLEDFGDLGGERLPDLILIRRLSEPEPEGGPQPAASWGVFLLSWDGGRWQASRLGGVTDSCQLQAIQLARRRRGIALVTPGDEDGVLFPAVYSVRDHKAALLWDGQADNSLFHGAAHSVIKFRQAGAAAEMIVTGRADPGLLDFAPDGRRGFDVTTEYRWDGQAFVPGQTRFSANPDYVLYRFIAALHLRDFRAAYALVDPAKFMRADAPTLDTFRQFVEKNWPEFLDDQIFVARARDANAADDFAFALAAKHYAYDPTFSADGKLLVGLERETEPATEGP